MGNLNRTSGKPCPICSSSTTTPEDAEYIRCTRCGMVRTRYSYNAKLYGPAYAKNYVAYATSPINIPLNLFRLGLVSRWLRPGESLLDVGCAVGEFIRFAEKYYNCSGFEPNEVASKIARKRCDSLISEQLNGFQEVKCITMFDVLEHIEEPVSFLQTLLSKAHADVKIVLTTPNVEVIPSWNDVELRQWKHYKPEEHLFLYTEDALSALCKRVELEPIHWGREESDIRPGNPDGDILTCVARKSK